MKRRKETVGVGIEENGDGAPGGAQPQTARPDVGASPRTRIQHLDSCRGIAATLVVASHCLLTVDVEKEWNSLRIAFGHLPVLFFFVLSGYVLGRPLLRKRMTLRFATAYLVKRFCRLCPLLVLVFVLAFYAAKFLDLEQLTDFQVNQWAANLSAWMAQVRTPQQLWENILLIQRGLNVPTWTIKVELICSALLPFVVLLLPRRWPVHAGVLLILLFFGSQSFLQLFSLEKGDLTWFEASRYLYLFYLGFLVAYFDRLLGENRRNLSASFLLIGFGILLSTLWVSWGSDISLGIVMALLMVALVPLPFPRIRETLNGKVPLLLGHLSYGIYLLHVPVLLFLLAGPIPLPFFGLEGIARFPLLFLEVFVVTLVLSYLANKLVEDPLNALGHRIASLITGKAG